MKNVLRGAVLKILALGKFFDGGISDDFTLSSILLCATYISFENNVNLIKTVSYEKVEGVKTQLID